MDIFVCINVCILMKIGNFACVKIHVLSTLGSLGIIKVVFEVNIFSWKFKKSKFSQKYLQRKNIISHYS